MKRDKSTRNLHNHSSTRRKNNTLDVVDRISDLPDSILGLILSCLPTNNAVATSILSKRWEFVWTTIHNLDFCYERGREDEDNATKFMNFVDHVLTLQGGESLIKFRLSYLENRLMCVPLEMPINLFKFDSLQSLELNGSILLYFSTTIRISLPRLESLKLVSVYVLTDETFQKLLGGCPMLKHMHLDLRKTGCLTYRISSPSLRCLTLYDQHWGLYSTQRLELDASSIEYLKVDGCITHLGFVQGSLSSLVEADLGIDLEGWHYSEDLYNRLAERVRSFDCAKALTLSYTVMWALSKATISLSTKFTRLTKLKAQVVCCYCSSLHDFLQSSDSLEVLTVNKARSNFKYDDHSNWTAPVDVPKCLSKNLKEVLFEGYSGCEDEREIIGYLLKHGSALEVMQITCDEDNFIGNKIELVKEIRGFPKKSPTCIVKFIK